MNNARSVALSKVRGASVKPSALLAQPAGEDSEASAARVAEARDRLRARQGKLTPPWRPADLAAVPLKPTPWQKLKRAAECLG